MADPSTSTPSAAPPAAPAPAPGSTQANASTNTNTANLTMAAKLRSKIPKISRGWLIFGSLVTTYAALKYRDRRLTDAVRADLDARAEQLASQPLSSPRDRVRKICIVTMRPHPDDSIRTSLALFNDYVKPVLDKAAVDYDVVDAYEPGTISRHVAGTLAKKQRYQYWTPEDELRAAVLTTPVDDLKYFYRMQDYDAYVALGRKPFEEVVHGYAMGLEQARKELQEDFPEYDVPNLSAQASPSSSSSSSSWSTWLFGGSATSQQSSLPASRPPLVTPPIAYLPLATFSGMRTFPQRLYRWFNQHQLVRDYGEQALALAYASRLRPIDPQTDALLGVREFGVSFVLKKQEKPEGTIVEGDLMDDEMHKFWPPPQESPTERARSAADKLSKKHAEGLVKAMDGVASAGDIIKAAEEARMQQQQQQQKQLDVPAVEEVKEVVAQETKAAEPTVDKEKEKEKTPAELQTEREQTHFKLLNRYFVPRSVDAPIRKLAETGVQIYEPEFLSKVE
ncbi:inner membrane protein import complex subunit Tim54-domain-containing protein [Catenaria anguillulae PL171]|uniref:Mitochondrial import inner membrane translocase subunit TIM54 n=1 Tax=Catenaria anguillulae PL171 TaxID=765915 RepID=A0A1Y2H7P4_9FUNG|nr:inner membrane protein import complex subunit Tim54-domain-containing protein [Catenaria anguillulae PL171]